MATDKELEKDNIRETHWLGEVVDNIDPANLSRCRVKVYGKFDLLETESIPWATAMNRDPEYWFQINQNKELKEDILDTSELPHDVISLVYDADRNVRIYHSPEDGLVITRGTGAKERPLIQIDEAGMIKISTDEKIFLDSGNIFLSNTGEGSEDETEPVVRGLSLETWLNKLLDDYKSHMHPTPQGPTGAPIGITPTIVSSLKRKHIDYQQKNK